MNRKEELASQTRKHGRELEEIARSDAKYSKLMSTAEKILNHLIDQTEAFIRGEITSIAPASVENKK
jgi:hypothetical protein